MNKKLTMMVVMLAAVLFFFGRTESFADDWAQDHPRRVQVNERLENQNNRIDNKVREGALTQGQAAKLHHEDRQIRQEERDMASQDGGHITKQEQRTLNQQENAVSRQIGR